MTNAPGQQTITPERQIAASQIGAVFNSMHEYLRTLEHRDEEGRQLLTKHLEFAHQRIDEAAMWAIKHVLTYGVPPQPKPAAETPAPIGVVDAAALAPDNAPTGADALPPTTPAESV